MLSGRRRNPRRREYRRSSTTVKDSWLSLISSSSTFCLTSSETMTLGLRAARDLCDENRKGRTSRPPQVRLCAPARCYSPLPLLLLGCLRCHPPVRLSLLRTVTSRVRQQARRQKRAIGAGVWGGRSCMSSISTWSYCAGMRAGLAYVQCCCWFERCCRPVGWAKDEHNVAVAGVRRAIAGRRDQSFVDGACRSPLE